MKRYTLLMAILTSGILYAQQPSLVQHENTSALHYKPNAKIEVPALFDLQFINRSAEPNAAPVTAASQPSKLQLLSVPPSEYQYYIPTPPRGFFCKFEDNIARKWIPIDFGTD